MTTCWRCDLDRRPGQAKREPGPINTKVHVALSWGHCPDQQQTSVGMGPRVRGEDSLRALRWMPSRLSSLPFSPCGRRWRGRSPCRMRVTLHRQTRTPHPSSLREATLSHKGRRNFSDYRLSFFISMHYRPIKRPISARLHIGNKIGVIKTGQARQRRSTVAAEDQISTCSARGRQLTPPYLNATPIRFAPDDLAWPLQVLSLDN
jgi:hypothetical protein